MPSLRQGLFPLAALLVLVLGVFVTPAGRAADGDTAPTVPMWFFRFDESGVLADQAPPARFTRQLAPRGLPWVSPPKIGRTEWKSVAQGSAAGNGLIVVEARFGNRLELIALVREGNGSVWMAARRTADAAFELRLDNGMPGPGQAVDNAWRELAADLAQRYQAHLNTPPVPGAAIPPTQVRVAKLEPEAAGAASGGLDLGDGAGQGGGTMAELSPVQQAAFEAYTLAILSLAGESPYLAPTGEKPMRGRVSVAVSLAGSELSLQVRALPWSRYGAATKDGDPETVRTLRAVSQLAGYDYLARAVRSCWDPAYGAAVADLRQLGGTGQVLIPVAAESAGLVTVLGEERVDFSAANLRESARTVSTGQNVGEHGPAFVVVRGAALRFDAGPGQDDGDKAYTKLPLGDGVDYLALPDGGVLALAGSVLSLHRPGAAGPAWTRAFPAALGGGAALLDPTTALVATDDGELHQVALADGTIAKTVRTDLRLRGAGGTVSGGRLLTTTFDGDAVCLDPATGKTLWRKPLGDVAFLPPLLGPPARASGMVQIVTRSPQVWRLDDGSNAVRAYDLSSRPVAALPVPGADGAVASTLILCADGALYEWPSAGDAAPRLVVQLHAAPVGRLLLAPDLAQRFPVGPAAADADPLTLTDTPTGRTLVLVDGGGFFYLLPYPFPPETKK